LDEKTEFDEFLSHASKGTADGLRPRAVKSKLEKGQYAFFDGDDARDLYIVEDGVVEINIVHSDGKVYVFHYVFAGEIFGEAFLSGHDINPFSAVARRDVNLWKIPSGDILKAMEADPGLASSLTQVVGDRLYRCFMKARCIAGERVEKRVACILLKAVDEQGMQNNCARIDPPLTNRDISALIGSTEETVSRIMSRLKKGNIVGTEGRHIVVLDIEALQAFLESG
jgi:CRP/FNR family transcriptional regulator, cyclic AMP receptor protein